MVVFRISTWIDLSESQNQLQHSNSDELTEGAIGEMKKYRMMECNVSSFQKKAKEECCARVTSTRTIFQCEDNHFVGIPKCNQLDALFDERVPQIKHPCIGHEQSRNICEWRENKGHGKLKDGRNGKEHTLKWYAEGFWQPYVGSQRVHSKNWSTFPWIEGPIGRENAGPRNYQYFWNKSKPKSSYWRNEM